LRAFMYGLKGSTNLVEIREALAGMVVPEFKTKSGVKIGALFENSLASLFFVCDVETRKLR